jgi:hypothetical protein
MISELLIGRLMGTVLFGTMWLGAWFLLMAMLCIGNAERYFFTADKQTEQQKARTQAISLGFSFCCTFPLFAWVMHQIWFTDHIVR